jgi:maleamate amidohydrolase
MCGRLWDDYLSVQDHALARVRGPVGPESGARPALLLIDVYRAVFGDAPRPVLEAVAEWPRSCGLAAWEALPRIQRLLEAARERGLPVIHVTGLAEIPSWRRSSRGPGEPFRCDRDAIAARAADFEIVPEVAPREGEIVLRKSAPSAFFDTALPAVLNDLGIDWLLVAGESTSGCVRASVVDARSYRYATTVVEDCVFDRTEASHALSLFDMAQKYADVRPSAAVIPQL